MRSQLVVYALALALLMMVGSVQASYCACTNLAQGGMIDDSKARASCTTNQFAGNRCIVNDTKNFINSCGDKGGGSICHNPFDK